MHHTATAPFTGDPSKAFDLAITILTPLGFRLEDKTPSSLRFTGPGMMSSRQSPLLGAGSMEVSAKGNELVLDADLRGLQRLARFVVLFPLGLCLFLLVIAIVIAAVYATDQLGLIITLAALPLGVNALMWLILGPFMVRFFRHRTLAALDAFLNNLAKAST